MIFCKNCFTDSEIRSIIKNIDNKGTCPFCHSENVEIYDTQNNSALTGIFDNLLNAYTPLEYLPSTYPKEDTKPISKVLLEDWNIFSKISEDNVLAIIKELSPDVLEELPQLFDQPVGILEKYDEDFLNEHSILKVKNWDDLCETLKHTNRFHSNLINKEIFKDYCSYISEDLNNDKARFYRGRIAKNKSGYPPSQMGAPPKENATDGRANSFGISRLYLTLDRENTLHEIRTAEFDYVTIATFKSRQPLHVVDLRKIASISPFYPDMDCTSLAINRIHLEKINSEISKTMRKNDSILEYLPTQYICDFIMSIEDEYNRPLYDGIEYKSAMKDSSTNIAVFYPEKFHCTYAKTYEVNKINYRKQRI